MKEFHICTISNRPAQYREMKESFIAAGFDETRCTYTLFDNSKGNKHEPFSAINQAVATVEAKYLIFCHQDVLLNQGHGYAQLASVIRQIETRDPSWAVLGNAGINRGYQFVARITDIHRPNGVTTALPHQVFALDENFLLINPKAGVGCSPELSGFHFYGQDICLHALRNNRTCYVIDFHLEHLGQGVLDKSFWEIRDQFQAHWEKKHHCTLFKTVTGVHVFLSKHRIVRRAFARSPFATRLPRPRVERLLSSIGLSPL